MSEYQYFEFQALGRPLTKEQMAELRAVSSRARITSCSFINEYNWGDFKGDPEKLMTKYFDIFLYITNWGTRRLMLRFPANLVDQKIMGLYECADSFSFKQREKFVILSFCAEEETPDWAEGEGWLARLIPIRSDLLRGDCRVLYLAWLLGAQSGELEDDQFEPPVPPGLRNLSSSLESFAEFCWIDSDLIAAAAENSPDDQVTDLSEKDFEKWLKKRTPTEKDRLLLTFIKGENMNLASQVTAFLRGCNPKL
ncbi:MAG: hypothetical protein WA705_03205 [Candidatus Ozemobacteraceae bacterium]